MLDLYPKEKKLVPMYKPNSMPKVPHHPFYKKDAMIMPKFIPKTNDTKTKLEEARKAADAATQELYAAEAAHKESQRRKKVIELKGKVDSLNKQVTEAHAAKVAAQAAMDKIPDDQDKTAHIDSHNKADLHHKKLQDELAAKKAELAEAEKALKGGKRRKRRRTRKIRRKNKKSKRHRRGKRHTKKHKRSRRKKRSRKR